MSMKMKSKFQMLVFQLLLGLVFVNCNKEDGLTQSLDSRPFYMGVTPWPADLTVEEVNKTYAFINDHCDIVSHHFNEGIPYEEFYKDLPLPREFLENIAFRKAKTRSSQNVFLSVAALNISRKDKDHYYKNSTTSQNIKEGWGKLNMDNEKIVASYVKYINYLIKEFNPIYVNYGVESNFNEWDQKGFGEYKIFLSRVYNALKQTHAKLPLFVSFMVNESNTGLENARQLLPYTDIIALSSYPYTMNIESTSSDPKRIPENFFEQYIRLDTSKSFGFAETGYIAQNLKINEFKIEKNGKSEWQKAYLEKVLSLSTRYDAKFFIWFTAKDYDKLVETSIKGQLVDKESISLLTLWQDTGLIDENDVKRPSYDLWIEWMDKEKK
jgi:hypothetical protein